MERQGPDDPIEPLREVAQAFPGLDALILYGSRARPAPISRCGDGRTIFERAPQRVERFRLEAIAYWLDMAPIIRAEYEARLEKLSR